ncbi:ABC transporter permease [Robiginitalea aurantiaca]|uniref:ABC transporter permease n=1 Tax=Robiginitalea aurantiaca TaxID=3056915 RepID=A0ABT7WIH0_9FLAO|nr:ABC transporter permease [Robiginitalea aurantiaca]MDM9632712.1 ABC transporter permease [Robiginitalea aurantiaca]
MYTLFLKIAARYLLKNKLYSFINIFGLAIGIASFILILLYVNKEKSYDKFPGSENVYRTYMDYEEGNTFVPGDAMTYNLSGPTLKKVFPEVEEYVRLYYFEKLTFKVGDRILEQPLGSLADPSYFTIFNYPLLQGDKNTVLEQPYSIVLSRSFARKLFGDENPMKRTLSAYWDGHEALLTVTGVMEDIPETAHYRNSYLISYETEKTWTDWGPQAHELNWNMNNYYTYLRLTPGTDADLLREKIIASDIEEDEQERHNIEAIEDIHLYSNKPYEVSVNGSATRIKFLSAIAFIILILSWLNYINLSATKSLERAKETGIRKVAGAKKSQLILQSLVESFLLNIIATGLALILVFLLLPVFEDITSKELSIRPEDFKGFLPYFGFILGGMVIAGIYPAMLISRYAPIKALKGKISTSAQGLNIRKALIITQFLATIVLLTGTIVVTKQINFMERQPIGTNVDQVIALSGAVVTSKPDSLIRNDFRILQDELQDLSFIQMVSASQTYPGDSFDNLSSTMGFELPNGERIDKKVFYTYYAQPGYFELMDIEFAEGGTFLPSSDWTGNQVVVNETFLKQMGIASPSEILNQTLKFWGNNEWRVAGVIKDYYHFGLKSPLLPMVIRYHNQVDNLLIRVDASTTSTAGFEAAIGQIKSKWKAVFPQSTFNYTFLDEKFEAQYKGDKAFGQVFQVFTLLAIFIASMGLFGLTSYTVVQRKKEIGIRKVNGATITQVLTLLNKDFVKWIALAFIIAVPVSWYVMNQWLEGFAYRTALSWWIFALAGITALLIALLTVSWQSFRAAIANPVESIRDE